MAETGTYYCRMPRSLLLALALVTACSAGNPENRAACGFALLGAANNVRDQLQSGSKVLADVPSGLRGIVPTRALGHGTTRSMVADSPDGPIVAYDGEGFPSAPGFGVALVEDSTDTFQGVLIFDLDPPMGYPILGGVTNGRYVIPLYGLRVAWDAVSTPNCPLFAPVDTAEAAPAEQ